MAIVELSADHDKKYGHTLAVFPTGKDKFSGLNCGNRKWSYIFGQGKAGTPALTHIFNFVMEHTDDSESILRATDEFVRHYLEQRGLVDPIAVQTIIDRVAA